LKRTRQPRQHEAIEYEANGKVYQGTFYVEGGWVSLRTGFGQKSAALNRSNATVLARILFGELISDHDR
jgi:hypothetical protein